MEKMINESINVSGFIDTDIMCHSVSIIDKKLNALNIPRKFITKTKLIATELVQNAIRHGEVSNDSFPYFHLEITKEKEIILISGNAISDIEKAKLETRILSLKELSGEEISLLYKETMNKACIDCDDNAGLGLISIFLRTDSKINCSFVNEKSANYFTISATINLN